MMEIPPPQSVPSQWSSISHGHHASSDGISAVSAASSVELSCSQKPRGEDASSFSAGSRYSEHVSSGRAGEGGQSSSGLAVDPLSLLYLSVFKKAPSGSIVCRLDTVGGQEALVFPEFNCYSPARLPSGLESRRKELFTLADIFLLLSTPKELYTYTHVAQQGHRYINVLERAKITAFFENLGSSKASLPPVASSSVTDTSSSSSSTPDGRTSSRGLGEDILDPEKQFLFSSLSTPTASQGSVFPLDPSQPVKLPGFVLPGGDERDRAQGLQDGGQSRDASRAGIHTLHAELDGVMPQAWSEVDVRCLVDAVNTAWRELKSANQDEKEQNNGVSASAEHDDQDEQGSKRHRTYAVAEALSALAFYRMERPVVLRSSTIKLEDSPFDRVIQTFNDVEKERWAGRPLAQFSHQPRPDQRMASQAIGGSYSKGGSSGAGQGGSSAGAARLAGGGGRSGAPFGGGSYGGSCRRGEDADAKTQRMPCVLDEVCVHRKRKPIILIPPVTSMGGAGFLAALLTRYNVLDLLENGNFISPQAAKERAAREGTLSGDQGRLELQHEVRGRPYKFVLIETSYAAKFTPEQWKCVVAVILNGASSSALKLHFGGWPFRDWIDLFQSYKGVMFVYEEDAIPADVCGLNVKVIRLSRSHRYNDAAAASDFWASLEEFLLQPRKLCLAFDRRLDASSGGDLSAATNAPGIPGGEGGSAFSDGRGSTQWRSFGTSYGRQTAHLQRPHPARCEERHGLGGQRDPSSHQFPRASMRHGQR